MQCPLCLESPLEPKYVGTTEVDICPSCRGIWLDRGELDRLLADTPTADPGGRPPAGADVARSRDDRTRPKRKKSKAKRLADLFEEVLDL
jgi:Zn-finger nucleic acid-binding protein